MNKLVTFPASGQDRISALPDDIICNILSSLYVEESARTSILSKRWRKMWLLSPIIISDESIVKQSCMYCFTPEESFSWIVNAMSLIVSIHPGPIHTCHLTLPDWDEHHVTLVNLLKILTLKGIQNLQIGFDFGRFDVPCFVFECDSLVNVHLQRGSIPAQLPAHTDIFPNLRKLTLKYYDMNNEFLVNLLSSRSIVELTLFCCFGLHDVVIKSDSLHKFCFGVCNIVNLTIMDAPNLESFKLEVLLGYSKVAILNAPKLKVLSRIDMKMSKLQLGSYLFDSYHIYKCTKISSEITYMPSLRSLDIVLDFDRAHEVKSVPHFLMCFPCLETLEVSIKTRSSPEDVGAIVVDDDDDDEYVRLMSTVNCLNNHLKSVRLCNYHGSQVHLYFAGLIIANAKVLETLTIVYGKDFKERWMKSQRHFLMQNRASKMLRVEFLKKE